MEKQSKVMPTPSKCSDAECTCACHRTFKETLLAYRESFELTDEQREALSMIQVDESDLPESGEL